MIKQKIGGKNVNTVNVNASDADTTTLLGLLEGELTTYDLKAEGGTSVPAPAKMNAKKFSVGKKYLSGQTKSASVFIPHIKPSKTFSDISVAVIGQFDEDFIGSAKCEYSNLIYDKSEV
jgi:hypothetical protein